MIETAVPTATAPRLAPLASGLLPSASPGWRRWIGPILSLAVLLASLWQLRQMSVHAILAIVPHRPLFWLLFVVSYLILPASEWLIFRRLWQVPASAIVALIRKRVSNEVLFGYSGELYFYAWARRNARIVSAPFGAIKDVAILSAAVGNACTLVLLALSWPLLSALHLGLAGRTLALSVGTIALSSLATLGFRRALFSLPRADLGFIAVVHAARVIGATLLTALLWASVLPTAPLAWWLALATLRMLVSRLPFIPNKDLVFAGLVSFLVGHDAATADLFAMLAGLVLTTHLLLGAVLGLSELLHGGERRCA